MRCYELQDTSKSGGKKDKNEEYVEALKKGGIDQKTARNVLDKWKEAGAEGDPNELRKLFLKQSLVPISATLVQVRTQLSSSGGVGTSSASCSVLCCVFAW